jgi:hypothetical protein
MEATSTERLSATLEAGDSFYSRIERDSLGPLWPKARPMPNLPLRQRVSNHPIPMQLRVGHPALCVLLIPTSLVVFTQHGGFQPPALEFTWACGPPIDMKIRSSLRVYD